MREVDVAYSRIMLLGTAGVGKTSFKRGLMNEQWDCKADSTLVSDINTLRPVGHEWHTLSRRSKYWKLVTEDDEIDELAHLLAAVHNDPDASMKLLSTVKALSLYRLKQESSISASKLSKDDIRNIQESKVNVFLSKAFERARWINNAKINPLPLLHVWDCGGQPVFLEILPAFLTSRSMFLLLFDASKSLNDNWKSILTNNGTLVEDEVGNTTTKDLLFRWMANIHHQLAKKDELGGLRDYPRMYCIGTHKDIIKSSKKAEEVRSMLKESYKSMAFAHLIQDTLIVDNTTAGTSEKEDSNFKIVRDEISNFTFSKLSVKAPLCWVLFRNVIQMLDTKVISLKEAHAIGAACKIPHSDVPKALLFYHDLGAILFYPNIEGLKEKVIVDPKWFVDMLGRIFTLQGREEYQTESMWTLLREKGILVQALYVGVWRECSGILPNEFMDLLIHFRLAAEVKTRLYYDESAKQYFLPAVLKFYDGNPEQQKGATAGYLARATPLHITFSANFVPPGFFTRFITALAESPMCELNFDEEIYRNRISMKFGDPCIDHIVLIDLGYAIQVEVMRYMHTEHSSFSDVCQCLLSLLNKCGQKVDNTLNTNSITCDVSFKITRETKYVCSCEECKSLSLHYLEPAVEGQTADLPLTCLKQKKARRLTLDEAYWFIKKNKKEESKRISQQEMYDISKRVGNGNKALELAAVLGMYDKYKCLNDPTSKINPILQLLYDWDIGGGERMSLVASLAKNWVKAPRQRSRKG
ncbi:PREDICTED: uncharacterized protein LOC109580661 [Amphimedon queenslandica]|uniref:COR domain-containing protein n=1 Tax=Amphimedon queenslandica TaxID=400682 RepID=A0AAN0IYK8_AMPQE|nr:PREDICTED: uncharacterized protein LOC109580661 [Amphimedon queenslandica]|eukprot:XP_019849632.1 PREDICTED: uncharacterized protein LOC109580661 [Amphimedon queenslandica]